MVIATRSTAIGAFESRARAEQALCALLGAGFPPDQVGMVLPDAAVPAAGAEESGPAAIWAGGMFRSLVGVEVPDDEVRYYEEALQEGRALVMVRAPGRYAEAMEILHSCGGEYMEPFGVPP
jgi:hypothetical protein